MNTEQTSKNIFTYNSSCSFFGNQQKYCEQVWQQVYYILLLLVKSMENIKTKYQCFCRNQNCRRVFNSRSQQLRHEKQCSNPKKAMIETFRKVSNNTYECKKYSKQITHHYNLKHREVPVLLAHFAIKYFSMSLT